MVHPALSTHQRFLEKEVLMPANQSCAIYRESFQNVCRESRDKTDATNYEHDNIFDSIELRVTHDSSRFRQRTTAIW